MAAAVFAVNRGISTTIVGSLGESWFTGGLIDLMEVHPISKGKTWQDPWAATEAVKKVRAASEPMRLCSQPAGFCEVDCYLITRP